VEEGDAEFFSQRDGLLVVATVPATFFGSKQFFASGRREEECAKFACAEDGEFLAESLLVMVKHCYEAREGSQAFREGWTVTGEKLERIGISPRVSGG